MFKWFGIVAALTVLCIPFRAGAEETKLGVPQTVITLPAPDLKGSVTVEQALPHCHVEITTLLIGGENDQPEEIAAMARWLASLSPDIPLHLSRYYPAYRFTRAATPEQVMRQAREIAAGHLHFVYLGNLSGVSNDTCCLNCGRTLVQRQSYFTRRVGLKNRHCAFCGQAIHYMID